MYYQVYHSLFSWIFFGCNEKIDSDPSSSKPNPIYLGQAVWVWLFYSTIYKNKTMFLSIPNPGVYSFGILYTVFATSTVLFKSSTGSRTLLDTFRVGTFLRLTQMLKFWNTWLIYIWSLYFIIEKCLYTRPYNKVVSNSHGESTFNHGKTLDLNQPQW